MFERTYTLRMRDSDAAGLIYFAEQFRIAHETFEEYLERLGFGFGTLLRDTAYVLPIVHAESDYRAPLHVGDRLTIRLDVERIGDSSFTLRYDLSHEDGRNVGTVKTVHVATDRATRQKVTLPFEVRELLQGLKNA